VQSGTKVAYRITQWQSAGLVIVGTRVRIPDSLYEYELLTSYFGLEIRDTVDQLSHDLDELIKKLVVQLHCDWGSRARKLSTGLKLLRRVWLCAKLSLEFCVVDIFRVEIRLLIKPNISIQIPALQIIFILLGFFCRSLSDKMDESDAEGEAEENEDGNYTVYECPGLAPVRGREPEPPTFETSLSA